MKIQLALDALKNNTKLTINEAAKQHNVNVKVLRTTVWRLKNNVGTSPQKCRFFSITPTDMKSFHAEMVQEVQESGKLGIARVIQLAMSHKSQHSAPSPSRTWLKNNIYKNKNFACLLASKFQ